MERISRFIERLRFRFGPTVAQWMIDISTFAAQKQLREQRPIGVLVDNTVLGHATTHQTAWVSTGAQPWGDGMVETGYTARIAVHPADSDADEYPHLRYLPGLISLHRHGHLALYTSAELKDEQFRQPLGRFRGYGIFDYNLFQGLNLESVDGTVFPMLGPPRFNTSSPEAQQRDRLAAREAADADYASLVKVLGRKNSQDAWHIRTAEIHGMFCFLTLDMRLINTIYAQRNAKRIRALTTRVMTPADLGKYLHLIPTPLHILSYTGASFPVRGNLNWPDGKRRRRRKSSR